MEWVFLHKPEEGFEEMTLNPYENVNKIQKMKNYAVLLLKIFVRTLK